MIETSIGREVRAHVKRRMSQEYYDQISNVIAYMNREGVQIGQTLAITVVGEGNEYTVLFTRTGSNMWQEARV